MTDDLKPCPFCGSIKTGVYQIDPEYWPPGRWVGYCEDCGAEGPHDLGESGAVKGWNKRAAEDALQVEITDLHRIIETSGRNASIDLPTYDSICARLCQEALRTTYERTRAAAWKATAKCYRKLYKGL